MLRSPQRAHQDPLFKARTFRLWAADSPSPAQTRRRDKATPNATPPSSGPLFPPPPQEGQTPALGFKPTQHGAAPQGACVVPGTGRDGGGGSREPREEVRGQRALRGVRSSSSGRGRWGFFLDFFSGSGGKVLDSICDPCCPHPDHCSSRRNGQAGLPGLGWGTVR